MSQPTSRLKPFHSSRFHRPEQVLVVEDEKSIREAVAITLQQENYRVLTAADGETALMMLRQASEPHPLEPINLLILDLILPKLDGLDLCKLVRNDGYNLPILMISARTSEIDRITGLEIGADDYLPKPFGMRELVARCRALLRRSYRSAPLPDTTLTVGEIQLSTDTHCVTVRGEAVSLTPKEFMLLELLMREPQVWSREQLLQQVWGQSFTGDARTVDVHIRMLREKLEINPSQPNYILTVRGVGYRLHSV